MPPSVCNPGEGKRNEERNRDEARSERFEEEK